MNKHGILMTWPKISISGIFHMKAMTGNIKATIVTLKKNLENFDQFFSITVVNISSWFIRT